MKNNTKIIMENWRKFLKEGPDDELDLDSEPSPLDPEKEYLYDDNPEEELFGATESDGDFTEVVGYNSAEELDNYFDTDEQGYSTNPDEFQPGRKFKEEYLSPDDDDDDEFFGQDL